jgi:hypothetical protein
MLLLLVPSNLRVPVTTTADVALPSGPFVDGAQLAETVSVPALTATAPV